MKNRPGAQVMGVVARAKQVVAVAGMSRQSLAICPFVVSGVVRPFFREADEMCSEAGVTDSG